MFFVFFFSSFSRISILLYQNVQQPSLIGQILLCLKYVVMGFKKIEFYTKIMHFKKYGTFFNFVLGALLT